MRQKEKNDKLLDIFKSVEYMSQGIEKLDNKQKFYDEIEYIYIKELLYSATFRLIPYKDYDKYIIKISKIIKEKFPRWRRNKYYKKFSWKYRVVCNLIYLKKINILRKILHIKVVK